MKEEPVLIVSAEAHSAVKAERDNFRSLLFDLWCEANPSILEDNPAAVRLSPEWNKKIQSALADSHFAESGIAEKIRDSG